MARSIDEVIEALPTASRRKVEERSQLLIREEMSLQELRQAREMTQVKLAEQLGIAQKQISEIEKRTDLHISTLRRSIEAMGGKLSLVVEFPNSAPILLNGFSSQEK